MLLPLKGQSVFVVLLIVGYFASLVTAYATVIPVFEESDEAEHFLYVHSILENGALPVIRDREALTELTAPVDLWNNHTHHAPLYYLISAAFISWSERADIDAYLIPNDVIFLRGLRENNPNKWLHSPHMSTGDTASAVYALRGLNGLLGVGTLLLIFMAAYTAWGRFDVAAFAALLTASIPSFIAVHASISNDALVIFIYAAGVLWLVKTWDSATITTPHMIAISLIVAGAALSKLTGLTLLGVVLSVLIFGVWRGRFERGLALRTALCMMLVFILLAGWWYVRNFMLYGDFFALSATQSLWGRIFDIPDDQLTAVDELLRVLRSFWLMIGYRHQPLLASDLLLLYGGLITVIGLVGLTRGTPTPTQRAIQMILLFVCGVATALLMIGTRDVDISYGRILFPALPAFTLLIAFGLWRMLSRHGAMLALFPLIYFTLMTPQAISDNYPRLIVLEPAGTMTDGLIIENVHFRQSVVRPGDPLYFEVIFAGASADNPYLLATVIDSVTQERRGHVEVYPGIAPTNALQPDGRYRALIRVPSIPPETPSSPRRLDVLLQWGRADDETYSALMRYEGPLLVDPRYQPSQPSNVLNARFGEMIALDGYELKSMADGIALRLWWRGLSEMDEEWILTVQMLNADDALIAQIDGPIPGYPTTYWTSGLTVVDDRLLIIPPDTPPGDYRLILAWYRLPDLQRLVVTAGGASDQSLQLTQFTYPFASAD